MFTESTIDGFSSNHVVMDSLLMTMLYAQHTQILKHSSLLLCCAVIAFSISAGAFVGLTLLALMDPSGLTASLLIVLLKCVPTTAVSGGLFWAYLRLHKRGIELCAEMAKLTGSDRGSRLLETRKNTKRREQQMLSNQVATGAVSVV
jgi:hypothetical protein